MNTHTIIQSDVYKALNYLDDNSIDIAITSPPYWNQRNYGFDNQIGNESTYMDYISRLVFLFNILKEKMVTNGVFFLNIGDKYLNKYGKSPLGLIPYKLSYFIQQNGWVINDIIIWYKPNHMPSSVKNRFVNSYEPIIVLSKNKSNYFRDYTNKNQDYTNIIDVNLQHGHYKHIATYPQMLVSKLLKFIEITKNYTVLDPFAGSGTTLKCIDDINNSNVNKYKISGKMIEYNTNYITIIKNRISLSINKIVKLETSEYNYPKLLDIDFLKLKYLKIAYQQKPLSIVNIFENNIDFYNALKTITNEKYRNKFPKNEIMFIGLKNYLIEDIYNISFLKGWIVRNMIVVRGKKWYPIFMLVPDNKTHKNNFNYKALCLKHKLTEEANYHNKNYIGYRVENNIQKKKNKGKIVEIVEQYKNGLPKYVLVVWNNKILTKEIIINDSEEINKNIKIYKNNNYMTVRELKELTKIDNVISENNIRLLFKDTNIDCKTNKSKINNIERKNWGASPGARISNVKEFFVTQRLYNVNQTLIANYLNYIRNKKKLTKKEFINLFPKTHNYIIGHWLRKDFGGSIPVKEDWELLKEYFNIDQNISNYVCKKGLKLQTIIKTKYKKPADVIDKQLIHKLIELNTITI